MKFNSLAVRNLRAVERFEAEELGAFVVVAGQNGSGKSCVFDAVRLLKSLYGGYSANEYHQWFGEFAINVQDRQSLTRMFRDPDRELTVEAELEFTASELTYLRDNAEDLALPIAWQRVTGQNIDHWNFSRISVATQLAQYQSELAPIITQMAADVRGADLSGKQQLGVAISPSGDLRIAHSTLTQLAFQAYKPEKLGVIEYHSASRTYTRQDVGGITLDSKSFQDQRRQSTLYNWQSKYQNVKNELASGYIRNLIARESGVQHELDDLNETLAELFRTFFPDKEYLGVNPLSGGNLEFPVRLPSGRTHDIDDLSSGEKEILYGYLRLRNSAPRGSILLLDEPELHLNPSLLHGFADFYYRHLGVAQGNQLWLITHSDTLLRQAVGNSNYRVFHMMPASAADDNANQAREIHLSSDLERATIDLVGDLASYRPHARVVIFEGEGDDGFDVTMVRRLFPAFAKRVNLVSGGNKARVRGLYQLLADSAEQLGTENRFFSVADRDNGPGSTATGQATRDRYHIENYLLEPDIIRQVVNSLSGDEVFDSGSKVLDALRSAAGEIVEDLALKRVNEKINADALKAMSIGAGGRSSVHAQSLATSLTATAHRLAELARMHDEATIDALLRDEKVKFNEALADDSWSVDFPGRLILKRFVKNHTAVGYSPFVNLILDRMAESRVEPRGMKEVLDRIQAA